MSLEELARTDNENHVRQRFALWPPAMFLVAAALCLLLVPLAGFGAEALQPPDEETVRLYEESGLDAPQPQWTWDEDAFNDKGRLLVGVGAGTAALGLLWFAARMLRRALVFRSEPQLIQWVRNEPGEIARFDDVDKTYRSSRGRPVFSSTGVVATRHDGRTAAIHAIDPIAARRFLESLCRRDPTSTM